MKENQNIESLKASRTIYKIVAKIKPGICSCNFHSVTKNSKLFLLCQSKYNFIKKPFFSRERLQPKMFIKQLNITF
jgi:hypothetical protein